MNCPKCNRRATFVQTGEVRHRDYNREFYTRYRCDNQECIVITFDVHGHPDDIGE